ncbi:hypothetical protein Q1695_012790 [Nippostrongylus brasiliensis]|nr:hypothetical protein Q1695_012790 [Nippostrongylus brasiliensis]
MRFPLPGTLHLLVLVALPVVSALVDCYHGFVGRMQTTVEDDFVALNDTRVCAAYLCIKVIVHSAFDDEDVLRQGISSRCGYTGGDRAECARIDGCKRIAFFDGMVGNFSFCCCRTPLCNRATTYELETVYTDSTKKKRNVATYMKNVPASS